MDLQINLSGDHSPGAKHSGREPPPRGSIGIRRARSKHTERPVIFSVLCNTIDRYFLDVMTAGLLSHF